MSERKAIAKWEGTLKEGKGSLSLGSGTFSGSYSFDTRFGEANGTNPEELLGAALAACYAMALNATLEKKGLSPVSVSAEAKVFLGKDDSGFKINRIDISTVGSVDGIDADAFSQAAEEVKNTCIVSKALASVPMTLEASLV